MEFWWRGVRDVKTTEADLSDELSPLVSSKVILHIRAGGCCIISRAERERLVARAETVCAVPVRRAPLVLRSAVPAAHLHKPVPVVTWTDMAHPLFRPRLCERSDAVWPWPGAASH